MLQVLIIAILNMQAARGGFLKVVVILFTYYFPDRQTELRLVIVIFASYLGCYSAVILGF